MRKLLLILTAFISVSVQAQFQRPNNSYGTMSNRQSVDSTLFIPTGDGTPSLRGIDLNKMALYGDSVNNLLQLYNPKTKTWGPITGNGYNTATSIDSSSYSLNKTNGDKTVFVFGNGVSNGDTIYIKVPDELTKLLSPIYWDASDSTIKLKVDSMPLLTYYNVFTNQLSSNSLIPKHLLDSMIAVAEALIPTNNNTLTNGAGYITNIGGLVTAGTNVTVTGSGTSGSPYVVSSTGGGGTSSPNIVYLSQSGCVSDAELSEGSTTFGTDNTTAIQTVLNKGGTSTPLLVIWDGKYSVTGLKIKGNTEIYALPGMGAILRNNSNKPLFINYDTAFSIPIVDSNITITGGIWNGNSYNSGLAPAQTSSTSTYGAVDVFSFIGAYNVKISDFTIYRQRIFGIRFMHTTNATVERGLLNAGSAAIASSDGVHVQGNSYHITIKDIKIRYGDDDAIALTADDLYATAGPFYPATAAGPISDVIIKDIHFDSAFRGIRILSAGSIVDNISIKNISGYTSGYSMIIDNWWGGQTNVIDSGSGHVGTIQVENFNVGRGTENTQGSGQILLGCNIQKLVFKDFKRNGFANTYPTFLVKSGTIDNLIIDGYDSNDTTTSTGAINHISIASGATVTNLRLLRQTVARAGTSSTTNLVSNSGTITNLTLNGVYTKNINYLLTSPSATAVSSILATNVSQISGTYAFSVSATVPELIASNFTGGTPITSGTFTSKSGDAFTGQTLTTLTDGATITWAYDPMSPEAKVTLGGNRTLSITGLPTGKVVYLTLAVTQDATGSRTLTLPASTKVINGGAGAVTLTPAANATDILSFRWNGTTLFCTYGNNYN